MPSISLLSKSIVSRYWINLFDHTGEDLRPVLVTVSAALLQASATERIGLQKKDIFLTIYTLFYFIF